MTGLQHTQEELDEALLHVFTDRAAEYGWYDPVERAEFVAEAQEFMENKK